MLSSATQQHRQGRIPHLIVTLCFAVPCDVLCRVLCYVLDQLPLRT